jgi:hypothetical protein
MPATAGIHDTLVWSLHRLAWMAASAAVTAGRLHPEGRGLGGDLGNAQDREGRGFSSRRRPIALPSAPAFG